MDRSNGRYDRVLRLADGRRLGYAEFGRSSGPVAFLFHGLPGSRLPTGQEELLAAQADLRLIAVDRPGFGLSDHYSDRRMTDWPSDLGQLATRLDSDRFSVVGVSAGGAYALACAHAYPRRLDKVVVVSSMVPLDLPGVASSFDLTRRFGYWLVGRAPGQARWVAWLQARAARRDAESLLESISSAMSEADRALMARRDARLAPLSHIAEAYRRGSAGVAHELQLVARPWGFRMADVAAPVRLFHGELDRNVPVEAARLMARALPECRATFFPNEGHLSGPEVQEKVMAALAGRQGRSVKADAEA